MPIIISNSLIDLLDNNITLRSKKCFYCNKEDDKNALPTVIAYDAKNVVAKSQPTNWIAKDKKITVCQIEVCCDQSILLHLSVSLFAKKQRTLINRCLFCPIGGHITTGI